MSRRRAEGPGFGLARLEHQCLACARGEFPEAAEPGLFQSGVLRDPAEALFHPGQRGQFRGQGAKGGIAGAGGLIERLGDLQILAGQPPQIGARIVADFRAIYVEDRQQPAEQPGHSVRRGSAGERFGGVTERASKEPNLGVRARGEDIAQLFDAIEQLPVVESLRQVFAVQPEAVGKGLQNPGDERGYDDGLSGAPASARAPSVSFSEPWR